MSYSYTMIHPYPMHCQKDILNDTKPQEVLLFG